MEDFCMNMEKSEVQEFYRNKKVFITGATGFVGKTLIEKLLRVSEVDLIYILIREKKGKSVEERINKIFENPLFTLLKSQKPNCLSKVKAIVGECGGPAELSIPDSNRAELIANVNIIFHVAATVNFDENLKTAYEINVNGTKAVIDMAKKMKKLQAIAYVSTAYSNCVRETVIEEKVYDYPLKDAESQIKKMTKEDCERASQTIIGKWPNTYTFTKAMAEMLVKNEGRSLPIGIFRPSIILSTYKEPIPGWLDNIYAVNGTSAGILTGFLRVIPSRTDTILDSVPVDMCVSALLVSAWEIAKNGKIEDAKNILVYNYTCGKENPLNNGLLNYLNFANGTPSINAMWYPCTIFVTNEILAWVLSIILQVIPAFFIDLLAILSGRKPRLVSLYMKVLKFMSKIKFFGLREWEFDNKNVQAMWKKLNNTDQELFPFSMASFSWLLFCKTYLLGIRKYILKEDDSSISQAKTKLMRFKVVHMTLKVLTFYLICYSVHLILQKMYNAILG